MKSCEEVATRWHKGRLQDLGFPDRAQAMGVYKRLEPEAVPRVESLSPPPARETPVPALLDGTSLGRALSQLPADRASEIQGRLFSLANAIAVADRLPLTEAEALRHSLGKALEGVDRGLAALAAAHHRSLGSVADTTSAHDLFRIGATLNEELRPTRTLVELEDEENTRGFDWDVLDEWLSEVDATLAPDGRPQR